MFRFKTTQPNVIVIRYLAARQSFTESGSITNSIYLGSKFNAFKFSGKYDLVYLSNGVIRVEFDFEKLRLLDLFDIHLGSGALEVDEKTGLGSGTGIKKDDGKKKAFFNWCIADEKIATARGGGGGIALWKRE